MRRRLIVLLLAFLLHSVPSWACTTFAVRDGDGNVALVGKSYDWGSQAGFVFANMTGITKQSLVFPMQTKCTGITVPETGKRWTAQYTSITFNQYGRDLPNAGMNDQRLVVETMEMEDSGHTCGAVYNPQGASETINGIQLVQYILDSFGSVDAFVRSLPDFAIVPSAVYLHYMICDPSECIVAEIRDNKLVITAGRDFADLSLPPEITIVNDLRYLALTNDYYECAFHGRGGRRTLSLEDYAGFPYGGARAMPYGPTYCALPMEGLCTESMPDICTPGISAAQQACPVTGCDQACRDVGDSWFNSNSVERFVRAAAGSTRLSGNATTVPDMFTELNNVFSTDGTTGASMWQIVYDLKNRRIHWRTIADGYDLNVGLTGGTRSLAFSDVGLGFGACATHGTLVVNVDEAPPCNASNTGPQCNPNHAPPDDLPTCGATGCAMSPYRESYNRNEVKFAVNHTWVRQGMGGFLETVQGALQGISEASAWDVVYNIWGGYPRGYTQCGRDVRTEDKVNLFLSSILRPYVNPLLDNALPGKHEAKAKDRDFTMGPLKFSYALDASFSGLNRTGLSDLGVAPDRPSDKLTFSGGIPPLAAGASASLLGSVGGVAFTGNSISLPFSLTETAFSGSGHGVHVSDDLAHPFCLDRMLWKIETFGLDSKMLDVSCHVHLDPALKAVLFGPGSLLLDEDTLVKELCDDAAKQGKDVILASASGLLQAAINALLIDKFPCGTGSTVAAPLPKLTAGWGGLDRQFVTARSGRTYSLGGVVTADRDSNSYEFGTFAETTPDYEAACLRRGEQGASAGWFAPCRHIDTVRMRSYEGHNGVSTRWTPSSEGEKVLLFDARRWDEESDEVTPAVLRVRVFPAEGPSSWQDMIFEALSTRLWEVK